MSTITITADTLAGTPEARVVRLPAPEGLDGSLYRVEVREAPPKFGHEGRNILSAVLIGMRWIEVGYVVGRHGDWFAYGEYPYRTELRRAREGARRRRVPVYVPPLSGGRRATVREAAGVVLGSRFGYGADATGPGRATGARS